MPIFLLMMIGYFFRRFGIMSDQFASDMNKFVFKIALPVNLFAQLYDVKIFEVWDTSYVLFCFFATLLSVLIAVLVARFAAAPSDRAEFVQASYRSSASLLGMAYIELIYGEATMGALMMIGCVPLYNVVAVIVLSGKPGHQFGRKQLLSTLKGIVTNPIILGIVIGCLWALTGLGLPKMLDTTISYIGRLASPMGLLAMGASLDFGKMFGKLRSSLVACFLKLVGFGLLFVPMAVAFGFTGEKLVAALIMLCSASTVAGYVMAKNMGHEGTLSSSVVMITTLLSSVTLTIWLYVLRSMGLI